MTTLIAAVAVMTAAGAAPPAAVGDILKQAGTRGGLVVCAGCGDPALPAALGKSGSVLVHALDADPARIEKTREQARDSGLAGRVFAERWDRDRLPYADNLVTCLVIGDPGFAVPLDEIRRVLAPRGAAVAAASAAGAAFRAAARKAGGLLVYRKPVPAETDEWTHWLHGPDGNAVADDAVAGPPASLRWVCGPRWMNHHNETPSFDVMVSAGGRVFYVIDESLPGLFGLPERWRLVARDAFNGLPLWKRPLARWGWRDWVAGGGHSASRFDQPPDFHRQLVAAGDVVYVRIGDPALLRRLDAATGETLKTYAGTGNLSAVLHVDGTLILSLHRRDGDGPLGKEIRVLDADSGTVLWNKEDLAGVKPKIKTLGRYTALYLAAGDGRVYYVDGEHVAAADLATGRQLWRTPRPPRGKKTYGYARLYTPDLCTLVAAGDVLLFCQTADSGRIPWNDPVPARLLALSARTGEHRWEYAAGNWGYGSPADVFVVADTAWAFAAKGFTLAGIDLASGAVKKEYPVAAALDAAHHHRCYRNKATGRYVFTGRRGVELTDLRDGSIVLNNWVRGACRYGVLPCNGLLYAPPDPCMCYATAKVNGLHALASRPPAVAAAAAGDRLEKGPAYGTVPAAGEAGAADWPVYRRDAARSGWCPTDLPAEPAKQWEAAVGGTLSGITAADGKVFVAAVDAHTVCCLDRATGKEIWSYTAGGPVDTPPTYHRGAILFGAADGRVYCLRAADGKPAWRFDAAAGAARVVAFGRLESSRPCHGAVTVYDDRVYATAGRSSFLDGGIRLYALDPKTGKILDEGTRCSVDPETGQGRFNASLRYDMPPDASGAVSDVLVADGGSLYMRHVKIDPADLGRDLVGDMPKAAVKRFYQQKQTGKTLDFGPQLVSTAGLLDDAWYNQTFWSYRRASHGRMLVFDDRRTYGIRAYGGGTSRHIRSKITAGKGSFKLFADDRAAGTRAWATPIPVRVTAMAGGAKTLCAAGTPRAGGTDAWAALDGEKGGLLWLVDTDSGKKRAAVTLDAPPVWDGMAVADGAIFVSLKNGTVVCLGG